MPSISPLFTWRSALASDKGPDSPTTRHVLLTLSLYMSEKGGSCFPPLEDLADDTGLAKATVSKHLKTAHENGWIDRRPSYDEDGMRDGTNYYATYPAALSEDQCSNAALSEDQPGIDPNSTKHANKQTQGAGAGENSLPEHAPTEKQVIEYGTNRAGMTEEQCRQFFNHYAAVDFRDQQGRALKWKFKLANWKANESKFTSGDGAPATTKTASKPDDPRTEIR